MRSIATILALAALVCLLAPAHQARGDWIFDADAGVVHETNVGLAQFGRDTRHDTGFTTTVSAGVALPLTDRLFASVSADASGI